MAPSATSTRRASWSRNSSARVPVDTVMERLRAARAIGAPNAAFVIVTHSAKMQKLHGFKVGQAVGFGGLSQPADRDAALTAAPAAKLAAPMDDASAYRGSSVERTRLLYFGIRDNINKVEHSILSLLQQVLVGLSCALKKQYFSSMTNTVKRFLSDDEGQDLIEYTLLIAFVALATAALMIGAGGKIKTLWTITNNNLSQAASAAS